MSSHLTSRPRISAAAPITAGAAAQTAVVQRHAAHRPPGQHLAPAGRGKSLPGALREKMERALGHDFSRVRIHEGTRAESLGAIAYTRGTDLHFAPGRYSPATRGGQELIGHELAHVVQQHAGRVGVPQGKGAPINADPALEAEAERLGAAAARTAGAANAAPTRSEGASEPAAGAPDAVQASAGPLQCANGDEQEEQGSGLPGLFGGLYGSFVARNLWQQHNAGRGRGAPVHPFSRLGAWEATRHFRPGQVGFGVHANIGWIHALLGNLGQSNIGQLFGHERAQRALARTDERANRGLGRAEHRLWTNRWLGIGAHGPATPGERFGGLLGSSVSPAWRAWLQRQAGSFRAFTPRGAAALPYLAVTGGLGLGGSALHERFRRRN